MNKLFSLVALTIGFTVSAQITTSSTNNSGASASAIGLQTTASGVASTSMGRQTLARLITFLKLLFPNPHQNSSTLLPSPPLFCSQE